MDSLNVVLLPLLRVLSIAIEIYIYLVIAMAILSWLVAFDVLNPRSQVVRTIGQFLWRITEPPLKPIRRILPNLGGIDISPVILILVLYFLQQLIFELMVRLQT
jgi:YggT family protein